MAPSVQRGDVREHGRDCASIALVLVFVLSCIVLYTTSPLSPAELVRGPRRAPQTTTTERKKEEATTHTRSKSKNKTDARLLSRSRVFVSLPLSLFPSFIVYDPSAPLAKNPNAFAVFVCLTTRCLFVCVLYVEIRAPPPPPHTHRYTPERGGGTQGRKTQAAIACFDCTTDIPLCFPTTAAANL